MFGSSNLKNCLLIFLAAITLTFRVVAQSNDLENRWGKGSFISGDSLRSGFLNPPDSARPQTWWHWMNGNITKEGITADLEAMHRVGISEANIITIDADWIPPGPVTVVDSKASPKLNPEFVDLVEFAAQEANRLGMTLSMNNCSGWSSSGGPWVTPDHAMQRVTISETTAQGPGPFSGRLKQPLMQANFYRDIAVLAFQTPEETQISNLHAIYKATDAAIGKDVTDIVSDSLTMMVGNDTLGGDPAPGHVKELDVTYTQGGKQKTVTATEGTMLNLSGQMMIQNIRTKAAFDARDVDPRQVIKDEQITVDPNLVVHRDSIVNLTAAMKPDGSLTWSVPEGHWTILRVGYTPTGEPNHPAAPDATGPECDKLSRDGLDACWKGMMQPILDRLGPLASKVLDDCLIDSWEVGDQNWTPLMLDDFKHLRGYDPTPFLPVMTGRVVDGPEVSERFLWDVRRTVADLFSKNYYGHFTELCHEHGLKSLVEPYNGPYESIQCGAANDIPMGEFWNGWSPQLLLSTGWSIAPSVKMASSVGHIYGQRIVGAESYTSGDGKWMDDPYSLKTLGDLAFCMGINRFSFHSFAHQPWLSKYPGMTAGPCGINFERCNTWFEMSKPWMEYLTRSQFLLQQGKSVADAAYFDGQSAPAVVREGNPPLPKGYDYDDINADVLLHGATVKNGRITLASGANYAVLILPPDDPNMTPQMLQCIRRLVRDGATVVGPRPQHSPSLEGYPKCDVQVKKLAAELWGKCDGTNVLENADGKGRVIFGKSLADILTSQNLKPDFEFQGVNASTDLAYTHRADGATDIYFVSNQRQQFDSAECTFRVSGKIPELWHPDTGMIEPAPVWSTQDGCAKVRLNFDPAGSVFVIFRHTAGGANHVVAASGNFAAGSSTAPKLQIRRAVYAATDGAGEMDVTVKLSELARGGQLVVTANNDLSGGDPSMGHEKELRVDYTLDGRPGHASVRENENLTLPPTLSMGQPPQWEASIAADGSPAVKAWNNGSVELQTADEKFLHAEVANLPASQEIAGAWNLSFPPNWGAPPSVTLENLISWTDHTNDGVRYFSGTATYEKDIEISAARLNAGCELWLDLGDVKNIAQVSLNGQDFDVLWKPPFRVNITSAAKTGVNKLVVKVTNLWPNRLIGDEQLPEDVEWRTDGSLAKWPQWLLDGKPSPTGRLTFTTWHHYTKDSPLLESGLLGPVILKNMKKLMLP
jgi:hypothetical protein